MGKNSQRTEKRKKKKSNRLASREKIYNIYNNNGIKGTTERYGKIHYVQLSRTYKMTKCAPQYNCHLHNFFFAILLFSLLKEFSDRKKFIILSFNLTDKLCIE